MITERTLRNWRKQALNAKIFFEGTNQESISISRISSLVNIERILRLTQELLDQHLLRK